MKRQSKPNLEGKHAIKEEAARLLRGFQHREYYTEQNIIKHSPEIQRILARSFVAHNNMTCNNSYCACGCDFYKYGNNDEYNPDTILYDDDVEASGDYVWRYPICSRDCWKRLGYLMNHFTEDKIDCLCQCHHNNEEEKKSGIRRRPSAPVISLAPADAITSINDNSNDHNTDVIPDLVIGKCLLDDCSQYDMGFVTKIIRHHMSVYARIAVGGCQVRN